MKIQLIASLSPEGMLRDAVDELGLKEVICPEQPIASDGSHDAYCREGQSSTWKNILGFRNLYAEFEWRENNGLEPLEAKYIDPFMNYLYVREDWKETVCKYYETGDRRYLKMFWDRGKDSDYERKYLPLESYGNEPIYA